MPYYDLTVIIATDDSALMTQAGPHVPLNVDGQDIALLPALPVSIKSITS